MKIAIIGPSFFGYLEDISDRLNQRGLATNFYDERPSNRVLGKLFVRLAPRALTKVLLTKHTDKILEDILRNGTTNVLLVSVETIVPKHVQILKESGISVSYYGWDSIINKPVMSKLLPHLDHVASFDPEDCQKHGFASIPLFSSDTEQLLIQDKQTDFFYCTTLHSSRPQLVVKLKSSLASEGFSARFLLFYHSKLLWAVRYSRYPAVWPLIREVSTTPFTKSQIAQATRTSRVVIDIHHRHQSGLTMRTFEALSMDAILVSTNRVAHKELPPELADRVVYLDIGNLESSLKTAQEKAADLNGKAISKDMFYALSVDRFLDQIIALLKGEPVKAAFPKTICKDN